MKRKLGIVCECITSNNPVDNLDIIKDAGFDCFFSDCTDIKSVSALKNKAEKLGLVYEFMHGPYTPINDMWVEGEGYLKTINPFMQAVDSASECKVQSVIVHVSSGWTPPPVSELGLNRFCNLLEYAEKKGVNLAFENQRLPEYLLAVIERVKDSPNACFCYDCGHESCFSPDFPVMDTFGKLTKHTHFHDNFGKVTLTHDDLHMLPFDGKIDYQKVMDKLDEFGYKGSIMFETFDGQHSLKGSGKKYRITGETFVKEAYKRAQMLNELSKK